MDTDMLLQTGSFSISDKICMTLNSYKLRRDSHGKRKAVSSDSCQDQQVYRIEPVKEVFHGNPSFSIIKINGKEGQWSRKFPAAGGCSGNTLVSPVISEEVQDLNQQDTLIVIICMQQVPCDESEEKDENLNPSLSGKVVGCHHDQKTDQQCEKYILPLEDNETSADCQVKGNLRNQRKQEKPQGIFFLISGMEKAFYQKKTEDREGRTSDHPENTVNITYIIIKCRGRLHIGRAHQTIFQYSGTDVVYEHAKDSNYFQSTAGKTCKSFSGRSSFMYCIFHVEEFLSG